MREVRIKGPAGSAEFVVELAHRLGIAQVSIARETMPGSEQEIEVVSADVSTPRARLFVDQLVHASFYDPAKYTITSRQVRALIQRGVPLRELTYPLLEPSHEIRQELWQFGHLTLGLVMRVIGGAMLLSYGLLSDNLLFAAGGLLFLPLVPNVLGIAFGLRSRDFELVTHAGRTLCAVLLLIFGVAFGVGAVGEPILRYPHFDSLRVGAALSIVIGAASAAAAADDTGRRELVGLAVASQICLSPCWLGLALAQHLSAGLWSGRLLALGVNVATLVLSATVTYWIMGRDEIG